MTDQTAITVAAIVAVPPTVASVAALVASLRNSDKIESVRVHINSRMDQLLKAENAKGRQDERDAEQGRR